MTGYFSAGILFSMNTSQLGQLFMLLRQEAPDCYPVKCGIDDDLSVIFAAEQQDVVLQRHLAKQPNQFDWVASNGLRGHWWREGASKNNNKLTFGGNIRNPVTTQSIKAFFQASHRLADLDFGWLHLVTVAESKNHRKSIGVFNIGPFLHDLQECIPNLAWGTILGAGYVNLMSRERLLTAPVYCVEEWPSGVFYVQLTSSIKDLGDSLDEVEKVREETKAHLGEEFFFSEGLETGSKRAPRFH